MENKPTDSELEVLSLIWEKGPLTVREIHDQIKISRNIGYTTTLKIMQIMHEKGMLKRVKKGKTHLYRAGQDRNKTQNGLMSRMLNMVFQGSTKELVIQALGNSKPTKDELDEIRAYLDQLNDEMK